MKSGLIMEMCESVACVHLYKSYAYSSLIDFSAFQVVFISLFPICTLTKNAM